jgi:dihydrofolate reductase
LEGDPVSTKTADKELGDVQEQSEEVSMRRIVVSEFVSLDGVVENPSWTFQFGSEEQQRFKYDELSAADALLLGRVTYEGFSAAWPHMTEQAGEYADMMNGYPKYVVSTTLEEPLAWNNSTLIKGDVAEEVSELKRQPGGDILVFGSGSLVNDLVRLGLIDEYRLMVFPVVLGSGQRLFGDGIEETVLELVGTDTFDTGVVLTYRPAEKKAEG